MKYDWLGHYVISLLFENNPKFIAHNGQCGWVIRHT